MKKNRESMNHSEFPVEVNHMVVFIGQLNKK